MRALLMALAFVGLVALMTPAARSETANGAADDAGRAAAIRNVIESQLAAFRRSDAPAAFAHASPTIQQYFATRERFVEMVSRGYPQIYRSESAQFLDLQLSDGRLMQRVLVRGAAERLAVAVYIMVQVDGTWRIDGCYLAKSDDA